MRSATALATTTPFGWGAGPENQPPLPIPGLRPVLPAPLESGPRPSAPLHERASRFLQAVVEALTGERPIRQLAGWLDHDVYRAVERRTTVGARPGRGLPTRRSNARIVSVRIDMITPTVAEISGRFVHRGRSRAIAARLELLPDHRLKPGWRCTALEWA